jgi:succinate dehydrogenase flavin-adding protein (antitoxin of CptAB toxin-antitoxin module)
LFAALSKQSKWIVKEGTPQNIANIATAYSKLKIADHHEYFAAISDKEVCRWIVKEGKPQEIANIATAYSNLEIADHHEYFAAISDKEVCRWIVKEGTPQAIANIATAYSNLRIADHHEYFAAISDKEVCRWIVKEGTPQAIANIATAYSNLEIADHYEYFAAISDKEVCRWIVKEGTPQNIANIATAYSNLGIGDNSEFFMALSSDSRCIEGGGNQNICNVLWSFACLGLVSNSSYHAMINSLWKIAISLPASSFTKEGLQQMRQFYTSFLVEGGGLLLNDIPPSILLEIITIDSNISDSKAHSNISLLLTEMGWEHKNEVSPFIGNDKTAIFSSGGNHFMAIDIANVKDRIAIEVDGPFHFLGFGNSGRVVNGRTKMKTRLLKNLGWRVVRIPWFEWQRLEGSKGGSWKEKQVEYLKRRVSEVQND